MPQLKVAFFGSSLLSSQYNPAAAYFRGIIRALHDRGHIITYYEPDDPDRRSHRDIDEPEWSRVVAYPIDGENGVLKALDDARVDDVIIKVSSIGILDDILEAAVPKIKRPGSICAFWDIDAPATLDRIEKNADDPLRKQISLYDLVFTHSGGDAVANAYDILQAKKVVAVHNAIDPRVHHHVTPEDRFKADLGFWGDRLPVREQRVDEFFFGAARELPYTKFLLAGSGWQGRYMPENVKFAGDLYSWEHNAFNSTPLTILNVAWESISHYGFSPSMRVFEAAAARACIISEDWDGLERFFEPGKEIIVAKSGVEVATHLREMNQPRALAIGEAAYERVTSDHTYAHRAAEIENALCG